LKKAIESNDVENIKEKTDKLTEEFNKLAQKLYAQTGEAQGQPEQGSQEPQDDVVDADFEEIHEDDNK